MQQCIFNLHFYKFRNNMQNTHTQPNTQRAGSSQPTGNVSTMVRFNRKESQLLQNISDGQGYPRLSDVAKCCLFVAHAVYRESPANFLTLLMNARNRMHDNNV